MLLAVCKIYNIKVWIHHGIPFPVIYKVNRDHFDLVNTPIIHIQCISGVHFNPLYSRRDRVELAPLVITKNVNSLNQQIQCTPTKMDNSEIAIKILINMHLDGRMCSHDIAQKYFCIATVSDVKFCALIDTGAQISLISDRLYK